MDTMIAYRLLNAQTQPEFQEVPEPHAAPGQVVVKVGGSGLCHTDFTVISRDLSYWKDDAPPFTLGHEIAGWVEEVGAGVKNFKRGDAVAVNPSWASCGRCHMCRSGEENHCLYQKAIRAPGVGYDGGHAPYVLVPEARFLVPIGDLDPVAGGGSIPFDFFKMPPGAQLVTSLNGGTVALKEIVDLAALGRIKSLVDRYPLSAVKQAYDDFEHKRLVGRAVVLPEGSKQARRD
jgi:D-arabinose 1-dehydrogenase-like Zn-dependent alcohol dehydrogenase